MNAKELKDLIEFLIEKDISEFELERGDVKMRMKRASAAVAMPVASAPVHATASPPASAPAHSPAKADTVPSVVSGVEAPEDSELHMVRSPIVGTFYEAASPGAPPLVQVGDTVKAGQVLCIVEAMKLMNEIESDVSGTIVKRYTENAQPVEYGQTLFALRVT